MSDGIFGISITGLRAAQMGLSTTGHNITNASTPGYNRQQIVQSTNTPLYTGAGFLGQGTNVSTVKRIYSQFLDNQVQAAQTQSSYLDTYYAQISQLDNMLADPSAGLSPALQEFFAGVHDVSANPASVPSRQSMLSSSEALVSRFQALNQRFEEIRDGVNSQITASVSLINSYAQQIATLNHQVVIAEASANGQPPNDLLDQRDQLVAELNKEINVSVVRQDDGSYNIFMGKGQALVVGQQALTLSARPYPDDPESMGVAYVNYGGSAQMLPRDTLDGGNLGGLLAFRSETLDQAQNELGRVAIGLAQSFNDQHRLGQDLNGDLGGNYFNVPAPKVVANTLNASSSSVPGVTLNDVGSLTSSDYTLTSTAAGVYTLQREQDGLFWNNATSKWSAASSTFALAPAIPLPPTPAVTVTADGMTIAAPAPSSTGDNWLIQPTRNGAKDISVAIRDTAKIAAASPISANPAYDPVTNVFTNTGTGKISAGIVNSFNDRVTFTFNGTGTAFDVVDTTTGATLAENVTYTAGANVDFNGWRVAITGAAAGDVFVIDHAIATTTSSATISQPIPVPPAIQFGPNPNLQNPITIGFINASTYTLSATGATTYTLPASGLISFNGWTVQVTGTPAGGDSFTVGPNTGGVSDNRNALLLAGLQTTNTLAGSTATYQSAYSQIVSAVGVKSRDINVTGLAQASLVTQTQQAQQSMSGVNLDEEAANLLRYQQAYQASGKMMQIATTLFETLLSLGE